MCAFCSYNLSFHSAFAFLATSHKCTISTSPIFSLVVFTLCCNKQNAWKMLVKEHQLLATRLYFVILSLTSTALRLELIFMYLVHGCVSMSTFMTISPKLFSTHSLSKAVGPLAITGSCTHSEIGCSFARHFANNCQAMLVFRLAVYSEQVAIQISICCLSKRFSNWNTVS